MTWNHCSIKKQNRDPWRSNNYQNKHFSEKNGNKKGDREQQDTAHLEGTFRKFSKKNSWLERGRKIGFNSKFVKRPKLYAKNNVSGIIVAAIIIWVASGFYTIKEAECGVITRFGKFSHLVRPCLHWKPTFIDNVTIVNVKSVRELVTSGVMLTSDENLIHVEMNVQYHVTNPQNYLFNTVNADESLRQAANSALRCIIGKYTIDQILFEGQSIIHSDAQHKLEEIIQPYNMGISLLDINFQAIHLPEEVKTAFDNAVVARENEQQYINEAEAYSNEVRLRTNNQIHRILEEARAYKTKIVLEAQGEIARFTRILPEYKVAPRITRERLYIETMEKVLRNTRKVLINGTKNNNSTVLYLNQNFNGSNESIKKYNNTSKTESLLDMPLASDPKTVTHTNAISHSLSNSDIMDQRRANAQRNDYKHRGE